MLQHSESPKVFPELDVLSRLYHSHPFIFSFSIFAQIDDPIVSKLIIKKSADHKKCVEDQDGAVHWKNMSPAYNDGADNILLSC